MKLYSDPGNFQTLKIAISLKLTGTTDVRKVDVKNNDCVVPFLSHSKLPVLEVTPGSFLFSANVAAKYVYLKAGLVPNEDAENEILDWENGSILPCVSGYLISVIGHSKKDKLLSEEVVKVLKQLDSKLNKTQFLVGDSLSLSDVCVYATLFPLTLLKNCDLLDKFANVKKWLEAINNNTTVQQAVSEVTKAKGQEVFKASLLSQPFPVMAGMKSSVAASTKDKVSKSISTTSTASSPSTDQVVFEKVDDAEIESARKAWTSDVSKCPHPRERVHPILPKPDERNILITSALPYVNNVPHLGNIVGCVLSADVFSRFCRLRNYNVLYISGTDEYGTATETKAMQEGVTPQEICDKYNALHAQIYQWFNIDFDHFGRTSTQKQTEIAQDIFWKLHENGFVLKDSMEQLHCNNCQKFLADRFVEGTCPLCAFPDARGDQCDGCGKLINATELKDPTCKMCKSKPIIKSTNHLFVDLPKLESRLKSHLDIVYESGTWTHNSRVITNAWLRDGLKPRCISRDLKWGVNVPLEGYKDKVFYVWFDAPIGYISITSNYTEQWQKWWKNPDKVEMYNFLGKDNVPFHSVIFPACLLGAEDGYTVVKHMIATEYLNYEDTKFSKSRGTGVFGDQAASTGIPADVFRFYLLYLRPESQDTAFSWDDFLMKNNSELLNNLGNFINRSLSFLASNFGGVIQPMEQLTEEDLSLMALITREVKSYIANLDACRLRDGVRNILSISRLGNQYMQSNKSWVLAKGNPTERERAGQVVSVCCNVACLLSVLLHPYMPSSSDTIQQQLLAPKRVNVLVDTFVPMLQAGHTIGKPSPLFQKIEAKDIQSFKEKFAGTQEEKPAAAKKSSGKSSSATGPQGPPANPEEIARLTEAVANQGNKVRELKAQKADKSTIDAEVNVLKQLKQDLAAAGGSDPSKQQGAGGGDGKKKSKNKGGKPQTSEVAQSSASPQAVNGGQQGVVDMAKVDRLTQAVAEQGNKVRDLKTNKADKAVIDAEVATLMSLKRDLALAQGLDPDAAVAGGKKKGKKK